MRTPHIVVIVPTRSALPVQASPLGGTGVSIAVVAVHGQSRRHRTGVALAGLSLCATALVLALWSFAAGLTQQEYGPWAVAGALLASAVLAALCLAVAAVGLSLARTVRPAPIAARATRRPIRSSDPDAAGRPRPRAPGCNGF
jgi:hypothetical protein